MFTNKLQENIHLSRIIIGEVVYLESKFQGVLFMPTKVINLQDSFLNQVRKENVAVIIYLVNGFQLRGAVKGFDNFTVIIENDNKQQLVYKHAISTITPFRPLSANCITEKKDDVKA